MQQKVNFIVVSLFRFINMRSVTEDSQITVDRQKKRFCPNSLNYLYIFSGGKTSDSAQFIYRIYSVVDIFFFSLWHNGISPSFLCGNYQWDHFQDCDIIRWTNFWVKGERIPFEFPKNFSNNHNFFCLEIISFATIVIVVCSNAFSLLFAPRKSGQ